MLLRVKTKKLGCRFNAVVDRNCSNFLVLTRNKITSPNITIFSKVYTPYILYFN